ncbi:unnamed protein product [Zymoseptoria tritici ST99CH_1A5]|uniref:Uncharacterized protein n=1 Tax=Zymoseptoria tritici ST99CH_1A5 TaxID=1276529 RepID=A0A1Y6LE02_ZYMTR|nr:unnamed protein product [Zymoseptoria tritici ST99CH_1A5]
MAPQHMKLMEGDEINVTEDTLVKAGYNLNPEQLEAMRKKAGRLISIRFFGEESDRAFSFTSIDNRKSKIDALLIKAGLYNSFLLVCGPQLIITSSGTIVPDAEECERCKNQPGPFEHCMRWKGYFYNCCGNCKWHDMANSCELDKRFEPVKDLPPPVRRGQQSQDGKYKLRHWRQAWRRTRWDSRHGETEEGKEPGERDSAGG